MMCGHMLTQTVHFWMNPAKPDSPKECCFTFSTKHFLVFLANTKKATATHSNFQQSSRGSTEEEVDDLLIVMKFLTPAQNYPNKSVRVRRFRKQQSLCGQCSPSQPPTPTLQCLLLPAHTNDTFLAPVSPVGPKEACLFTPQNTRRSSYNQHVLRNHTVT